MKLLLQEQVLLAAVVQQVLLNGFPDRRMHAGMPAPAMSTEKASFCLAPKSSWALRMATLGEGSSRTKNPAGAIVTTVTLCPRSTKARHTWPPHFILEETKEISCYNASLGVAHAQARGTSLGIRTEGWVCRDFVCSY